jgi:hypothetical protein
MQGAKPSLVCAVIAPTRCGKDVVAAGGASADPGPQFRFNWT